MPPPTTLCNLYVASAAYADHAGNADTASNALKLGGYDASDYLRKDEVQTVTAAYQEIEWTTPGTYNWVVPEGVNSILVTTVGGGGGYGFMEFYKKNTGATNYGNDNTRYLIFPGGAGGEVVVNKLVKTTPGETLQIVVGNAGTNVLTAGGGSFNESDITRYKGKSGGDGGISYIARNGSMISSTKARGGAGGYAQWRFNNNGALYNTSTGKMDKFYNWYHTTLPRDTSTVTTKYRGGYSYYGVGTSANVYKQLSGPHGDNYRGANGYSGTGGEYGTISVGGYYNSSGYWRSQGTYINLGGGGSWGDGGSHNMQYGSRAGTGGGGMHYDNHSPIYPGYGMVRILAIGVTYDE